ncbi:unnamed protein product, partial [Mesorhabditis spiculigera]
MGSNCRDDPQMPQVGQIIEPHTETKGRYRVLRVIYSGPFSDVYLLGRDKNLSEKYAMKVERQVGNIRPVLKLDVYVLREMNGGTGFPRFLGAGQTPYYKYCIMELLGPDLARVRRSMPEKRFSTSTALQVCIQTLERLETLHDHGLLCRDVKAPNFAIGLDRQASTIYMLDFGFARKFKDKNGVLMKPRPAGALMGTFLYAPMASHNREEQCRRDDVESWFYMAWELLKGTLPWAHLYGVERHQLILEWKQFIRGPGLQEFLLNLPPQFEEILRAIDRIGFFERPDYRLLRAKLEACAVAMNVDLNEPIDWMKNKRIQRKANWVGDLGQSDQASALLLDQSDMSTAVDVTPVDVET